MKIEAREATKADLDVLEALYRGLESEMKALHPMWPVSDGISEPVRDSLEAMLDDTRSVVVLGTIDDYPFGFLHARLETMLEQADGEEIGSIRLIFVDHEAREVSVGEVMRDLAMSWLRDHGVCRFDAHVLPGHRLVKNFFEAGGFSARSIVMHHDDSKE